MKKSITLFLLILLGVTSGLQAQRMFGVWRGDVSETEPTRMVEIDYMTGDTIRTIDSTGVGQVTALAFDFNSGNLYASHGGGGCCPITGFTACLMMADTATGAVTVVGCDSIYGGNDVIPGLAVTSKGSIWGMMLTDNAGIADGYMHLTNIDPLTGEHTVMPDTTWEWCAGHGMAFGRGDTLYYQNDCSGFGWIDTLTGAFDSIGTSWTGFSSTDMAVTDMTYDPVNDIMYAAAYDGDTSWLATVNVKTGEFTNIGALPFWVNSIAMDPGPFRTVSNDTICNSEVVFEGDTVSMTGTYVSDTMTSIWGLDSLVILNLVSDSADYGLEGTDSTITAKQAGATYQWYDCDGDSIIPGETSQTFAPSAMSGSWACIITLNSCSDTSSCATLPFVSREDDLQLNGFGVYPNPANEYLHFKLENDLAELQISVFNMMGQKVKETTSRVSRIDISGWAPGMYLVTASNGKEKVVRKFIKN